MASEHWFPRPGSNQGKDQISTSSSDQPKHMARHVQPNLWQPSMCTQYAYQAQIGETARSDVQRALDR